MIIEIYLPFADATANENQKAELQAARMAILTAVEDTGKELVCITWTNGDLLAYFTDNA